VLRRDPGDKYVCHNLLQEDNQMIATIFMLIHIRNLGKR
jgi:hypothetical protein